MKIVYPSLRLLFWILLSANGVALWAQNTQYSISSGGKVIGGATMVKTVSKVNPKEVKLLFVSLYTPTINKELLLKDRVECTYRNDTLLYATVQNSVNSRVRVVIEQRLDGTKYKRKVNNKDEVCSTPVVKWSFIRFFEEKPPQAMSFLSEMFGKVFPVYKTGNTYSYTDHFGRKGKFIYDEYGNLVKAYIQTSMEDLEFLPVK